MKGKLDIKCLVRSARGFIIVAKGILGNYITFFLVGKTKGLLEHSSSLESEENSTNFTQLTLLPLKQAIQRENIKI